jgi:hypothetical protein
MLISAWWDETKCHISSYMYRQYSDKHFGLALMVTRVQFSLDPESKIDGCCFWSSRHQKRTAYPRTLQMLWTFKNDLKASKIYGIINQTSCKLKKNYSYFTELRLNKNFLNNKSFVKEIFPNYILVPVMRCWGFAGVL